MDTDALVVFTQVAETRSFVNAGRNLGLSASGVGKAIARLEAAFGARLFNRSTRSISLTTAGQLLLDRARRIVGELAAASTEIAEASAAPAGRLRIGLPLLAEPFLDAFADFKARHPEIQLELDFDNRHVDVIEENFDAVIRSGEIADSGLHVRHLGRFRMLLVASPDYLARRGTPLVPGDLRQHDCIRFRMPQTGKLQPWRLGEAGEDVAEAIPAAVICNTNEARLHFAVRGLGIAYMSDFVLGASLRDGRLRTVLETCAGEENSFQLLWPSGRKAPAKLKALIEFLAQRLSRGD